MRFNILKELRKSNNKKRIKKIKFIQNKHKSTSVYKCECNQRRVRRLNTIWYKAAELYNYEKNETKIGPHYSCGQ